MAAAGSLIGDSVSAELTSLIVGLPVTEQFISPAVVGPGVEFTGVRAGGPSVFTVDVDASAFTIEMPSGISEGNGTGVIEVTLGDLQFDGGLHSLNFVYAPDYFSGTLTHTANSVSVIFGTIIEGLPYEFRLAPEPGSTALVLVAIAGLVGVRCWRRGPAAS